jgi:glycine betaine catabolism A
VTSATQPGRTARTRRTGRTGNLTAGRPTVPPAPVDPAALRRALQPFGSSTQLPAAAYTDPAVFAWEQRHAVAAGWTCLGRADEVVPAGSDAVGVTLGDVPVLVTRGADGALRAFANTCRHRGHEVLGAGCTGTGRALTCPYHAWSYSLDGRLLAAPGMRDVDGFDASSFGLLPVPLAVWHGWVLVNATGTSGPLETWIGGLEDLVAPYDPARLTVAARHEYVLAANWKVVVENYQECYHCPLIHPELCVVTSPDSGDNYDVPGAWVGGSMDLRDGAETMSRDGRSRGVPLPGADPRKVLYLGLFPNLLISLHPDYVMAHRMVPLAADRTWVECSWLFPPEALALDGFDPGYAVDFWDLTNRQDWAACESVQRGLSSPHFRAGPLAPSEDAVHRWITLVGRLYAGHPAHT